MGQCQYYAAEVSVQNSSPIVTGAAGKCYGVEERCFATHLGPRSPKAGLVTTGAGACMVVAVHDTETDAGALAHISQTNKVGTSLILAKQIIMSMIVGLVGGSGVGRVQIFLFQGNGLLAGLYNSMSNGMLSEYRQSIVNHSGNGFMNYVYFPSRREIFPVTRTVGDGLGCAAPKQIELSAVLNHVGTEFSVSTEQQVMAYATM